MRADCQADAAGLVGPGCENEQNMASGPDLMAFGH
jgi:hypothetical protein